jgi:3',5'-nucleoside bisphosphate phosphatase
MCRSVRSRRDCPANLPSVRIDLHSHSTASDGTDPPAEVMHRARAAGLDVIALTDHDTLAGHDEARRAAPEGLSLVTGMELSARLDSHSVHLLSYLPDGASPELSAETQAIRDDRIRRGQAMVQRLRELGVDVTWEQVAALAAGGSVGRPHIARAMVAAGAIATPAEAFGPDWIGAGGRAYVSRYALDPARAIGLVRASGGAVVLAHPGAISRGWRIPDEAIAALAEAGLAGLEVDHPDHDEAERARLRVLAADLGLVVTGGSDDHGNLTGHRLGVETTSPAAFEELMALAADAGAAEPGHG